MRGVRDAAELRLSIVGLVVVWRAGRRCTGGQVGSRKARALLGLLAVERGRVVSLDRIVDALWGSEPPRHPAANVATMVSRLRATFGAHVVVGDRSGYRLGDAISVDLDQAAGLVTLAEARLIGAPRSAQLAARRAVDLLAHANVVAEEPNATWAERARVAQTELLRRALHAIADAALRVGDSMLAQSAAREALHVDPVDEAAGRALMRAYVAAGEPVRALVAYEKLRERLVAEFGVDPSITTRELHVAILRGVA
jgi:DNA-binding SARP family transcriptional activator